MPGHQASRPPWRVATVLPLVSLVIGMFGCAEPNRVQVSGNVDDDVVTVQAPHLDLPEPSLDAGFTGVGAANPGQPATIGNTPATSSPTHAVIGVSSWSRVSTVHVREGDQVQAGEVLVRLDSGPPEGQSQRGARYCQGRCQSGSGPR